MEEETKKNRMAELAAMELPPKSGGILSSPMGGVFRNDKRLTEDPMRQEYRALTELEKEQVSRFKSLGEQFFTLCVEAGNSRELSLAKTKMEEAVMWAVKAITQ